MAFTLNTDSDVSVEGLFDAGSDDAEETVDDLVGGENPSIALLPEEILTKDQWEKEAYASLTEIVEGRSV